MAAPETAIEVIAATCDMAHDWGAARPVPQLKQHLTPQMTRYLGLDVLYSGGPEAYFAGRVSVLPVFTACDVSVYPSPINELTALPRSNYFCIPKNIAETRSTKGDTVLTSEYLAFLNGFFGEYRPSNVYIVDPNDTTPGITFVEDAQSFADWAFDVSPSGDKPPRGIAGPAQLLDSATDASSWFLNVPSEGIEGGQGIGHWKAEVIDGGEQKYVWDGEFAFRSTKQVRLTAGGTVIDFPKGMKTGPSIRTLSVLMCAYLKKMTNPGTNIRNYMVQLLQYIPPDKREPGGAVTQRKLRLQEMNHIIFLAGDFNRLFEEAEAAGDARDIKHDFNLKLIAFLKYVGDKGQNIYAKAIKATAGTTGDRLSALSFVLFGDTPAIYRDGKGNHVFICPPSLRTSPIAGDPLLTNFKYQFLNSVYTRVKQIVEAARIMFSQPVRGGAIKDFVSTIFKDYSQQLLHGIDRSLNDDIPGQKVDAHLNSLSVGDLKELKQLTLTCPVFHSLRTNYVTFTDDDFLPDDIDEFTRAYQAPTIQTQKATPAAEFPLRPESTATIERKLDDPMNTEVEIEPSVGNDKAEEVPEFDNATLTTYLRNNYVTVPDGYDFKAKEKTGEIVEHLVSSTDTGSWRRIISILTAPPPGTPPRRPPPHDGSSAATASASTGQRAPDTLPVNASMATDEGTGSGSGDELSALLVPLPGSQGGRRFSFTIRRRSETRQTKKNRRMRKPRVIDVRV